jgi:hypothetical protein
LPLENRSKPRQIVYLTLTLIGAVALLEAIARWYG